MLRGSEYSNVRCNHALSSLDLRFSTTRPVCGEWAELEGEADCSRRGKSFLERDILIYSKRLTTILIRAESSFRAAVQTEETKTGNSSKCVPQTIFLVPSIQNLISSRLSSLTPPIMAHHLFGLQSICIWGFGTVNVLLQFKKSTVSSLYEIPQCYLSTCSSTHACFHTTTSIWVLGKPLTAVLS